MQQRGSESTNKKGWAGVSQTEQRIDYAGHNRSTLRSKIVVERVKVA
jgi:hypothetical protein